MWTLVKTRSQAKGVSGSQEPKSRSEFRQKPQKLLWLLEKQQKLHQNRKTAQKIGKPRIKTVKPH